MNEALPLVDNEPETPLNEPGLPERPNISPEQQEILDQIAEIDRKIDSLQIIRNSIVHRGDKGDHWERPTSKYSYDKQISAGEDALLNAYLEEKETSDLERDLQSIKTEAASGAEFYGQQKDQMFRTNHSSDGSYYNGANELIGRSPEDYSEEINALLDKLESLGLPRDEFIRRVNEPDSSYGANEEDKRVERVLREFKNQLLLEKNTKRLQLPNETIKMAAEALRSTGAIAKDYEGLLSRRRDLKVGELLRLVGPEYHRELDTYPKEVIENYFDFIGKRSASALGIDVSTSSGVEKAKAVAEDLTELFLLQRENRKWAEDVNFEVKSIEKTLAYAKEEENYLRNCFKNDVELILNPNSSVDDLGIKFDPQDTKEDEKNDIRWPILDFSVRQEVDDIRYKGNFMLKDFDHVENWRRLMSATLESLRKKFPNDRSVDPLEIIIALRKEKEIVEEKYKDLLIEQEAVNLRNNSLKALAEKPVS